MPAPDAPEAPELRPGMVLSYSAGTTSADPFGFRVVRGGANLLESLPPSWAIALGGSGVPPLVVNAYPAPVATPAAVVVDTYMSPRTAARAWRLAGLRRMPIILAAQPLFMGELALGISSLAGPHPPALLLASGGYPLPRSLEGFIRRRLEPLVATTRLLHAYGVAEVDAACLIGLDRDDAGEVLYRPRADVRTRLDAGRLLLSLVSEDDEPRWHDTGDLAEERQDGALVIRTPRLSPSVSDELERWDDTDWHRRTGCLVAGDPLRLQLRERRAAADPRELSYHAFAELTGMTWLDKPRWSAD